MRTMAEQASAQAALAHESEEHLDSAGGSAPDPPLLIPCFAQFAGLNGQQPSTADKPSFFLRPGGKHTPSQLAKLPYFLFNSGCGHMSCRPFRVTVHCGT